MDFTIGQPGYLPTFNFFAANGLPIPFSILTTCLIDLSWFWCKEIIIEECCFKKVLTCLFVCLFWFDLFIWCFPYFQSRNKMATILALRIEKSKSKQKISLILTICLNNNIWAINTKNNKINEITGENLGAKLNGSLEISIDAISYWN